MLAVAYRSLQRIYNDRGGNVALMTALVLPAVILVMFGGTTAMKALSVRRELQNVAQLACNRAVKPQRMTILSDTDRQQRGEEFFDELALERGFTINSRKVTAGWLDATVNATATVKAVPGLNQSAIQFSVAETCRGIPPYPMLGDVILSSNFKTPSGTTVDLPYTYGNAKWGVFTPQQVGWNGGSGQGVEIQDWKNGFGLPGGPFYLPAGVSNAFVVELDSGPLPGKPSPPKGNCGVKGPASNSSMYRDFELHPGTYRFSLWFFPRVPVASDVDSAGFPNPSDESTNRVAVYLEGTRPVTPKVLKLEIPASPIPAPDDLLQTWKKRSFDIEVTSYGLYRLTMAAEGCDDGSGGLFNDLQLVYLRRPAPEYNDSAPPATN